MATSNRVLGSSHGLSPRQKQEYGFLHGHDSISSPNHDLGDSLGLVLVESRELDLGHELDLSHIPGYCLDLARGHSLHPTTISQIDECDITPLQIHSCHLDEEDGYSHEDKDELNLDSNGHFAEVKNTDDHCLDIPDDRYKLNLSDHDFDDNNQETSVIPASEVDAQEPEFIMSSPPLTQSRALIPAPDFELHVGQEFSDVQSCRRALRDTAIAFRFEIQTVKSDKTRFTAKCASEGCPWRIHAAKLPGVPTFTIRTLNSNHTCDGLTHLGHQQATVQWVANNVEQRLRANPNYKPKEILEEIHRVHGISLSYKQAWRGKERIMAAVRGSFEEGYRILPQYTEQIRLSNPGSMAAVYGSLEDNCFRRLFVSYQASIYGFLNGCRPLLGIDKIGLKSKCLGSLLFATGFDGNGALFPLAFGVVDEENDDNWMWFLSELRNLLELNTENMLKLTILSNRKKGIVDGVEANFPTAFHGFCMKHLSESFSEEFNNIMLVNLFWEAANALTINEFECKLLEIEEVSAHAAYWVRGVPPHLWATAYFEGTRLGHLTANLAESALNWVSEASGLPLVQMMESIRRQLMMWFNERREASMQWTDTLVPYAEKQVAEAVELARSYQVLRADETEFEVISYKSTNIVDIRNRCCLCRGWQTHGLPCAHAAAALVFCKQNVYRFTESCFTVATYRKAYSQTIHPIPDKSVWKGNQGEAPNEGTDNSDLISINPPKSLQPSPRPRKRRARINERGPAKRFVHCSRCNQMGHFRTTCAAPI